MDDFDSVYKGHLQSKYYNNIVHMSPIDRLIAKNQQKIKTSSITSSSIKKPYLIKKEDTDEQKSMNKDTSVSATIRPRKRRINWSETFKERRRSRRLSHLPPIVEDIEKEIKIEKFCESFDEIPDGIKIEIKPEIIDDTDNDLQQEDNSNLVLNTSSDPNVLSNNYIHQQVEFTQENTSIFGNTINDVLNPSTCSENNFLSLSYTNDSKKSPWDTSIKTANIEPSNLNLISQELIQDDSSICSDELSQEDDSNFDFNTLSNNHTPPQVELIQENIPMSDSALNNSLNYSTYSENNCLPAECNKTNNYNLHLKPALTSPKTAYNKQTSMNLVDHELTLKIADNEQTNLVIKQETTDNLVVKQELSQETVDYEDTHFYNYPYNNTNIYDTEIHESESYSPKIIECWSFKTHERHKYSEIEENTSSVTTNVQNYDSSTQETQEQSSYKNNFERPIIIESSSLFDTHNELELSIMDRSVSPNTDSKKNQDVISELSLLNNSEITTPKANSLYLPSTYFDETNNKLINDKPILPVTQSHSEINYPKLENKTKNDPVLLNNITGKEETVIEETVIEETVEKEIPILQRNFYELSIDEKILYKTKLTFVTALELISIKELKNIPIIKEEKDVIPNQFSSSQELLTDNGNYTDQKKVPTSSEEKSFLLQHSNERNNTRHTAVPILIPERSSGSAFHPGRCVENCRACYVLLGSMDTACHIAQIKNPEKRKLCLESVSNLIGPNSCLCPTCFRIVQRKSSIAYLSKNVCMFMSCKLPASKHYKSELVKKIKCMLIKRGARIRSWANNTSLLPTCDTHHDEILRVIQCQLCGNRTTHKKILEISEIEDFNKSLMKERIPITIDADFFICKSCHIYLLWKNNKLSDSMNKPKDIKAHCNIVIKRICERHKIKVPVQVNELPETNIKYTDKNVLRVQLNGKPFKAIIKEKVPGNNIEGTHQNVFKIYSKLIPLNSITKNPENNIKPMDENVCKIPAKVISSKPSTVNKIFVNNIKDTDQNVFKIHSKETPIIPNIVNKVPVNIIRATDENCFKKSANLMSTKHNTINKITEHNITNTAQNTLKVCSKVTPIISNTDSIEAAKCIRFANIKNVTMKRVYPQYFNYSPVNLNMTRNFQQILPSRVNIEQMSPSSTKNVKHLRVIRTTQ